jgi:hypothetical protein
VSHASLYKRASKLRREVHKLREESAKAGEVDLRDVLKRVEREFEHNSFTDHAALNPVTPTTSE